MTEAEILAEIAEITAALSAIRVAGQSYTISTGSSSRTVTQANYQQLIKERRELYAQLDEVRGTGGITLTAGW